MAGGVRGHGLNRSAAPAGGRAWLALAALLAFGAVAVAAAAGMAADPAALRHGLDWQPGREAAEPWRLWTAAWVHLSPAHLALNVAAALGIGALGRIARRPPADALAWGAAWPLTQWLLAAPPWARIAASLSHYAGLSGVLHAGVVVLGLGLAWPAPGPADATADARLRTRERRIGLALLAGVLAKLLLEAPWNIALRPDALLGIAVAPLAHACGVAAGAAAWAAVSAVTQATRRQ